MRYKRGGGDDESKALFQEVGESPRQSVELPDEGVTYAVKDYITQTFWSKAATYLEWQSTKLHQKSFAERYDSIVSHETFNYQADLSFGQELI